MRISTTERLRFKSGTFLVPNLIHRLLQFILTGKNCRSLYIVKMKLSPTFELGPSLDHTF